MGWSLSKDIQSLYISTAPFLLAVRSWLVYPTWNLYVSAWMSFWRINFVSVSLPSQTYACWTSAEWTKALYLGCGSIMIHTIPHKYTPISSNYPVILVCHRVYIYYNKYIYSQHSNPSRFDSLWHSLMPCRLQTLETSWDQCLQTLLAMSRDYNPKVMPFSGIPSEF